MGNIMCNCNDNSDKYCEAQTNPPKVYQGDTYGSDWYEPTKGYVLYDKSTGKRFQKWVGKDGKFNEKEI